MLLMLSIVSLSIISCESDEESTTPINSNNPENVEEAVVIETVEEVEIEQEIETEEEIELEEAEISQIIRVSEVNTSTNQVTLRNFGNVNTDIGNYFLCLGPGTYRTISSLTTGSTMIDVNESITVEYSLIDATADGLSVFTTSAFGSTDPEVLIDYVQWGAANQLRVNQAVTAGRWNSADAFLENNTVYTFNGQATEFGVSFWSSN